MNPKKKIIVETRGGKLEGVFEGNLYVFKGVPYAAPPTGELRWLPPQPIKPWSNIRPAEDYQTIAPQMFMHFPGNSGKSDVQNEDCLFLNIFSPGLHGARRPVMVWIHGGAFCAGSGSMRMYGRGTLATKGNIVLVTMNYRLGFLGFLNLNELTRGRIPSTGNEGLQDQIAALRWIKENISLFGGDPDNVTVFGESAGAMSIGCLLNMPEAEGLFHRAILESPVGEMARPLDKCMEIAREFLKAVNVNSDDVSALRALPAERLLQAQRDVIEKPGLGISIIMPVVDGAVMPRKPLESLEAGLGLRVPTLTGSNLDEEKIFMLINRKFDNLNEKGLQKALSQFASDQDIPQLIEIYRKARALRGEPVSPFEIYAAVSTDLKFRRTAIRIAESQCKHACGGFNYLFCWKSQVADGRWGAHHGLEIGFVFGSPQLFAGKRGFMASKLSRDMQDAWVSFARTGNPSCKRLGAWPQYCEGKSTMIFDESSRIEKTFREEELRAGQKTLK